MDYPPWHGAPLAARMIVQGESEGERSGAGGAQAPVSGPLAKYLFLDGADPIPAGYRSQSFSPTRRQVWDSARLRDLLGYLEAAIRIEPMNKGFAEINRDSS